LFTIVTEPLTTWLPVIFCEPSISKLPVNVYEPVKFLVETQTLPLLTSNSPVEPDVVVSITSCNSPISHPLRMLTNIIPCVVSILET